jgi:flagellar biosynthesis protein FlhF
LIANVKTFKARSMPEALAQVKRELGPEAVILGTRSISGEGLQTLLGRNAVEVTAAPAGAAGQPQRPKHPRTRAVASNGAMNPAPAVTTGAGPTLARTLEPLYRQLVSQEVSDELARQLIADAQRTLPPTDSLTAEEVAAATRRFIARTVPVIGGIDLQGELPRRIAIVGGSGGGKTTVVAKLAALYKLRHKRSVAILSLDLQRVAAHDQMKRYGELIGVPVYGCQTPDEVRETLKTIEHPDLLFIDTPVWACAMMVASRVWRACCGPVVLTRCTWLYRLR